MGKSGKKRKRARREAAERAAAANDAPSDVFDDTGGNERDISGIVSAEDLEITIKTLRRIASVGKADNGSHDNLVAFEALYASPPLKNLRKSIFPFLKLQLQRFDPVDYKQRVTSALRAQKWHEALLGLNGMAAFGQVAKQGTVQRWVRDAGAANVDVALKANLFAKIVQVSKTSEGAVMGGSNRHDPSTALRELNGMSPVPALRASTEMPMNDDSAGKLPVKATLTWRAPRTSQPPLSEKDDPRYAQHLVGPSRVAHFESASDRQPPNHFDLKMNTFAPGTSLRLAPDNLVVPRVQKHSVPRVTGAFVLTDVFTAGECEQIIAIAERLGFNPDHPTELDAPTGIDACEWLADSSIIRSIFARVEKHLPARLGSSGRPTSINAWWRLFRYSPSAVYRPHIDGSWPASGLDPQTGEYVHDPYGDRRSRLTFLVYLNEGFKGGSTTFYLPGGAEYGSGLVAHAVEPVAGACLLFPQGNTASLIHEGSAVTPAKDGKCKYVIRSDVIFMNE